ncbi:hypothetical protein BS78_10G018500 [Paspalum vaginatum]|nr:hypothetical protein BS78_10G018500 [Paspalum vaginatum]
MATVGQPGVLRRITVHYANSPTRSTAEANLDDLDDDLLQFVLADVLPGQEGLYQSILEEAYNNQNHMRGAGTTGRRQQYHGESSTAPAATASRTSGTDEEQIASDFEYAKRLQQEMEDLSIQDDDISCVPSPSDSEDDHSHHEDEADRQDGDDDDDDPDNMTYEQRQALVESVGTEDRGLSDELISYLEPRKYKGSGIFSKKADPEACTICLSTFRNRDSVIKLPCTHKYHADCITTWLKLNKICPVCKYEVFGPS